MDYIIAEYTAGILFVLGLLWLIGMLIKRILDLLKFTKWYENKMKLRAYNKEKKAEVDDAKKRLGECDNRYPQEIMQNWQITSRRKKWSFLS